MQLGPDAAQRNINHVLEDMLLALESSKDIEDKEQIQELFLIQIFNILNASEEGIINQINLDNEIIVKLRKKECNVMLFGLQNHGFKIPLCSKTGRNRFNKVMKLNLINEVTHLSDKEIISDTVCSYGLKSFALDALSLAGEYASDVANRNLKELNTRIENIIYNVTIVAGQEAGFELASFVSGIIADTSVNLVTKHGTSYLMDYITGASIGYLLQSALSMDQMKGDAQIALKVANVLKDYLSKGASDVFASGFANAFMRFLTPGYFPGLKEVLFKHLVAKPGIGISKKISSNLNTTLEKIDAPHNLYVQAKNMIHDNVTSPLVQTVYRGPLRDFVKGYYGGLCAEYSKSATKEIADKYIKGKIKICLDEYVDHLFPGYSLTYAQYIALEDLTNNFHPRIAQKLQAKETAEKTTALAVQKHIENAYPNICDKIVGMSDNFVSFLENSLNIPRDILEKILEGKELNDDDLNLINEHKYGYYTNKAVKATTGLFGIISYGLEYAGLKYNHEKEAHACADLLMQGIKNPGIAQESLKKLQEKLKSFDNYPADKEKIESIFRNLVEKKQYFTKALRKFAELCQAQPTPVGMKSHENMLPIIHWFIDNHYNPTQLDEKGVSPIHLVIAKIKNEALIIRMLKAMLSSDADFSVSTFMGNENILHLAAFHGKLEVVKFLMSTLPNEIKKELINGQTRKLQTPLHCAIANGHKNIVVELIKNGASITVLDADENSPFALLKYKIDDYIDGELKAALQSRLDCNLNDEMDIDSMVAHEKERRVLMSLLSSTGKFMEIEVERCKKGYQPYLLTLIQEGQIDWAHHLVYGEKMHLPCIPANKSIMFCYIILKQLSQRKSIQAAELLNYLLHQIKANYPEKFDDIINYAKDEDSALLLDAVEYGNVEAIEVLLNHNANMNIVNYNGDSLLLLALKNKNYAAAKRLLEKGANPLVANPKGESPISYWDSLYHLYSFNADYNALYELMVKKLDLSYMAENYLHKDTNALLTYCKRLIRNRDIEFIKQHLSYILKKYPNIINAQDLQGQTLLHYCEAEYQPEVSLWLLKECKADPLVADNKQQTFCTSWNRTSNIGLNPKRRGVRREITSHLAALANPQSQVLANVNNNNNADVDAVVNTAIASSTLQNQSETDDAVNTTIATSTVQKQNEAKVSLSCSRA